MLVVIFFIYGIALNFFGRKIVWISAGIAFLLALVNQFPFAAVLSAPVLFRALWAQISPFILMEWEQIKNK